LVKTTNTTGANGLKKGVGFGGFPEYRDGAKCNQEKKGYRSKWLGGELLVTVKKRNQKKCPNIKKIAEGRTIFADERGGQTLGEKKEGWGRAV